MKPETFKMIINVELDENFIKNLELIINDEIKIAERKWRVSLKTEDRNNIREHARKQLMKKVSEVSRMEWDLSSIVTFKVTAYKKTPNITLPNERYSNTRMRLIRLRDGWEVDQETRDESVKLGEFHDFVKESIENWLRTAVYYGVASYV